jgi:hypothetical protein
MIGNTATGPILVRSAEKQPLFPRLPPSLARARIDVRQEVLRRLRWFDYYSSHGHKAALTCHYLRISRQPFYRWKRHYDREDLRSVQDRSHQPHRRRPPTWTADLVEGVLELRRRFVFSQTE